MQCNSGMAKKKFHKAKVNRLPDHYFVHFKREVRTTTAKAFIEELKQLDRNVTLLNFSVNVQGVVSKTGHGFAAVMSKQALYYVSIVAIGTTQLYLYCTPYNLY